MTTERPNIHIIEGVKDQHDVCRINVKLSFDRCDENGGFRFNPYLTNGLSHHYQLDGSTFFFRGVRSDLYLIFSMKFLCANRIASDGTPRSAASHLGLFRLPMSHKRDARLK